MSERAPVEIVNGYACRDCAEASLASRGIDTDQWDDDETSPLDTTPTDLSESND